MFSFKSRSSVSVDSFRSSSSNGHDFSSRRFTEESDMQEGLNKLQKELGMEREEKVPDVDEIEELKKKNHKNRLKDRGGHDQLDHAHRLEHLEGELEAARDSEKKMLLSLEAQTKQLKQTKVSLEEAKLEIALLQDSNKSLEAFTALSSNSGGQPGKNLRRRGVMSFSADPGEAETFALQRELKLAVEAEEKYKKAMDDLAMALKEQTMEAREAKKGVSLMQAELTNASTEVENSKASLDSMEEKVRLVLEEAGRLKFELDELEIVSKEKERGLVDCIKIFEGELNKAKEENDKLLESQRMIRDENSRLREMLKHVVNEANVAKESLEIARLENSQFQEEISEKENTIKRMVQEYESLKVSEAATQSSIKELKDMIDVMFSSESTNTSAEASPRDAKEGEMKGRHVTADDVCADGERSPRSKDIRSPATFKKKTILRKFGYIMKKRNPKSAT